MAITNTFAATSEVWAFEGFCQKVSYLAGTWLEGIKEVIDSSGGPSGAQGDSLTHCFCIGILRRSGCVEVQVGSYHLCIFLDIEFIYKGLYQINPCCSRHLLPRCVYTQSQQWLSCPPLTMQFFSFTHNHSWAVASTRVRSGIIVLICNLLL